MNEVENKLPTEPEGREDHDMTRKIIDSLNLSQAVIEFDPSGNILSANQNFLKALGYTLGEIEGKHHSMFVDSEYAQSESYTTFWKKLSQGEFQAAEFQRFGKGGREIWIQATYNPVLGDDGKVIRVVKFATDITRQKQSQKEIQNRSQAVIEFEPDGTIITANALFLATVGYSIQEIKGKHHRIFMPQDEVDTPEYQSFWPSLGQGEFKQGEFRRITSSGEELWLQGAYNPVFGKTGEVTRIIKGVMNITEQINNKKQAEQVGQKIASSISEMTTSINDIALNIGHTAKLAQNTEYSTDDAKRIVDELNTSSSAIGRIISVIQDLSEQTNLLALNATIEAARAGEAGRGFAVVANEVKGLATQTGEATSDIRLSIESIQKNITGAVEVIQGIADSVREVSTNTTTVASAVEEQSALMAEMNQTATQLFVSTSDNTKL